MGVVATLGEDVTEVEPGASASCTVKLFNDGTVVDSFHLDVLGDAKDWAKLTSSEVRVFPGEVETVEIVFSPPRKAGAPRGRTGYALRAMSQEDTDRSAIVEGVVEVGAYHEVEAELISRTLRGSRSARGRIALDNLGNEPVTLRLTGTDDDGKLRFRFPRSPVIVGGGTTRVVSYRLVPRSRFLRGEQRTHVYRIQAKGNGVTSETSGSLVQPAMLAPWVPKALLLTVAAAALGFLLLPSILTPHLDTALGKKDAASSQDQKGGPSKSPGPSDSPGAKKDDKNAKDGQKGAPSQGKGGPSGSPSGSGSPGQTRADGAVLPPPPALADDVKVADFRLTSDTKPDGKYAVTAGQPVADGQVFTLSDLNIENPASDTGTIQLRRDDEVLREFDLKDAKRDWHWTEPLTFTEKQKVTLAVSCTNAKDKNCTPAVAFTGRTFTTSATPPAPAAVAGTAFRLEADGKRESDPVAKGQILALSDLNIENLAGDSGTIELRRGDELLYTFDLKDTKKEWHWTEPLTFTGGQKVTMAVKCTNAKNKKCTSAVAFSGRAYALTP
ncbi:COG1470 family protein [Streptomyces vinaceus]|uniref:COG1470 family protein n=1 Tax=Streptomyces vinaceus TaxID=1960 RepID=UPI0036A9E091